MSLAEVRVKIAEAKEAAALAEPYNSHTDAIDYLADALEELTKLFEEHRANTTGYRE